MAIDWEGAFEEIQEVVTFVMKALADAGYDRNGGQSARYPPRGLVRIKLDKPDDYASSRNRNIDFLRAWEEIQELTYERFGIKKIQFQDLDVKAINEDGKPKTLIHAHIFCDISHYILPGENEPQDL